MKKLISFIAALAVVASSVVALAAPTATSSNPAIRGTCDSIDEDNYLVMYFALENNETLIPYSAGSKGKITIKGINAIQVGLVLDSTVFDTSETYVTPHADLAASSNKNDGSADLGYVLSYSAPAGYLTSVPEYLFKVEALLNPGYDMSNIPDTAVTFDACKVEYTYYNNVNPTNGTTNYTIYGANTTGAKDYDLTVSFTGTASGSSDPDPDPTPAIDTNVDSVVTFTNAKSDALKAIQSEGKQIKVLTETFTDVTTDTRFEITHNGETKTFGTTLGQYFKIDGFGTIDGSFGIAVVFPAGDNTEYTITRK